MKKFFTLTVLLCACMFLLYASAPAPEVRAIERLVPDTAFCFINVSDMDLFLAGIDSFVESLGLKSTLGKQTMKSRIKDFIAASGATFKFESLNFKKAWGFAILPPDKKDAEPSFELLIPINDPKKNFEPLKAFAKKLMKGDAKLDGDYAVVFPSGKGQATFPPKKAIDLREIDAFGKASVSCWFGVKQALKAFGMNTETLKMLLVSGLSGTGEDGSTPVNPGTIKIATGLIDLLDEIEIVTLNLQADKGGVAMRSNVRVTKGKTIDKLCKALSGVKGLTQYAKYVPADSFFTMSMKTDPDFSGRLMKMMYEPILDTLDITNADKGEIIALLNRMAELKSTDASFAFDLDMDFAALASLGESGSGNMKAEEIPEDLQDNEAVEAPESSSTPSPEEMKAIMEKLGNSININLVGVSDSKDKDKYRKIMEDIARSKILNKIVNSYLSELGAEGVEFNYGITYTKDKKVGSLICDELGFDMAIIEKDGATDKASQEKIEQMKMGIELVKPFFDRYKILLSFSNNKCYMAMGKDAADLLAKEVKGDSYPSPNLADAIKVNPKYKELYDSSQFGSTLSMIKYINMLKSIPGFPEIPELVATGKEVGIIGASKYIDGRLESTGYWSMDEIKRIFESFNKSLGLDKMLSM